ANQMRPNVGDTQSTANAPNQGQTLQAGQHVQHIAGPGAPLEVNQPVVQQGQQQPGQAKLTLQPGGAARPPQGPQAVIAPPRPNANPSGVGTAAAIGAAALGGAAVAQGRAIDPSTSRVPAALQSALGDVPVPGGDPPPPISDPFTTFDQAGYRWVPG